MKDSSNKTSVVSRDSTYCPQLFCEKRVGKYKSFEPGDGVMNLLTSSLLFLQQEY